MICVVPNITKVEDKYTITTTPPPEEEEPKPISISGMVWLDEEIDSKDIKILETNIEKTNKGLHRGYFLSNVLVLLDPDSVQLATI